MIIVGSSALQGDNAADVHSLTSRLAESLRVKCDDDESWRVMNTMHRVASQVGALDVGYRAGWRTLKEKVSETSIMEVHCPNCHWKKRNSADY